jgi:mRNA interferase MazF
MSEHNRSIRRGDIYYADLDPAVGSEQGGVRPVLILQNNVGNRHSPTVIVAAITSRIGKPRLPTHVPLDGAMKRLHRNSLALLEQVRTIDRSRLREYIGTLDTVTMAAVDGAMEVSFGLAQDFKG